MSAEPSVECVYCLRPMDDAEGWKVMSRPDDGRAEFLCPGCLELPRTDIVRVEPVEIVWPADDVAPASAMAAGLPCTCGHLLLEHDVMATRYCAATVAAGLSRACACPVQLVGPARSYDRR